MENNKNIKWFLILLVISIISALYGTGLSYLNTMEYRLAAGRVQGWHKDNWISEKLELSIPQLAGIGNRAIFKFDPKRPENTGYAVFTVTGCDTPKDKILVKDTNAINIKIGGECDPYDLSLIAENTFQPRGNDTRGLSVKLQSIDISSKLFVPIVELSFLATIILLTSLFSGFLLIFASSVKFKIFSIFTPLLVFCLFARSTMEDWNNLSALLMLVDGVLAGMIFCKFHTKAGEGKVALEKTNLIVTAIALLIVVLGGLLRFHGLSFGIPNSFHPDETPKLNAIGRMIATGNLNPQYFLHPSLLLYCTYAMTKIFALFGITGDLYEVGKLAGRTVSALAGTGSLFLTYLIGKRLYSPFVGLFASALLAVFPLHVASSRYLKEDALLTFWVLLVVLFSLKFAKKENTRDLIIALIFAGFSAGTKYTGALAILIVGVTPWINSGSLIPNYNLLKKIMTFGIIFPAAFLLSTPYSILDSVSFIRGFSNEAKHMQRGHTVSISAWSQYWMYHFSRSIFNGTTIFCAALSCIGAGILLYRRKVTDLYIVGLLLLFYLPAEWVKAKPAPQPDRYIFPCLPFMAIMIAEFVRVAANSSLRKIAPVICLFAFALPCIRSVELASEIKYDTRNQMADWMKENLPAGSKVLIDWSPYGPALKGSSFEVVMFPPGKMIPRLNAPDLKNSGNDYLVLSSLVYGRFFNQPQTDVLRRAVIRNAFRTVPIIKQIEPKYGTYGFHNPVITLFSLKEADFARLQTEITDKTKGAIDKTSNDMRASFVLR